MVGAVVAFVSVAGAGVATDGVGGTNDAKGEVADFSGIFELSTGGAKAIVDSLGLSFGSIGTDKVSSLRFCGKKCGLDSTDEALITDDEVKAEDARDSVSEVNKADTYSSPVVDTEGGGGGIVAAVC